MPIRLRSSPILRIAGAACALPLLACDPAAAKRAAAAKQHAAEAEKALTAGDFARAAAAADAAAEYDPLDPANVDRKRRVRLTALAAAPASVAPAALTGLAYDAESLRTRDPAHAPVYAAALATIRLIGQDVAGAEQAAREAVQPSGKQQPFAPAQAVLGRVLLAKKDLAGARAAFEAALAADPRLAAAREGLGTVLLAQGDAAQAATLLADAARALPDRADVQRRLGLALSQQKKLGEAAEALQRALKLDPTDGEAHRAFADILFVTGQLDRAQQAYEAAARAGAEPYATWGLGRILVARGEHAKAAPILAAVAASLPDDPTPVREAAEVHEKTGDFARAATLWAQFLERAAKQPGAQDQLAEATKRLQDATTKAASAPAKKR